MDELTKALVLNGDEQKLKSEFIKEFRKAESERKNTWTESFIGRKSEEKAWQDHLQDKYERGLEEAQQVLSNGFQSDAPDIQNDIDNMVRETQ